MLSAGVDLLRALRVAAEQSPNLRLKEISRQIGLDLEDGRLLAVSLRRFPDLFSPFFVSMVRQGEREGVLAQVLTSMADYLDHERFRMPGAVRGFAAVGFDLGDVVEKLKPLVFWQMLTLGVISLGIAGLWWASLSGTLPVEQFGPNVALWVGSCILLSALIFRQFRPVRIVHCSFCGQPESEVGSLVQGPGVAICQSCMRSNVEQMKLDYQQEAMTQALRAVEEDLEGRSPAASPGGPLHTTNGSASMDDDEPSDEGEVKRIEL
jgi:hypothetical protein